MNDPTPTPPTVIVVGASRGLGRAVVDTLAQHGTSVVAVSRTASVTPVPDGVRTELADAADPAVPGTLIARHNPDAIVLVAGAPVHTNRLPGQTWGTFSAHWHGDVRISFEWLQAALRAPLRPGGRFVTVSSGAAVAGSALSGGYAGAKATQRFLSGYAQEESRRGGLGLMFTTVLPQFAPSTGVGAAAVAAYAADAGLAVGDFLDRLPFPVLTEEVAGTAVGSLLTVQATSLEPAYMLNGAGLRPIDA